MLEWPLSFLQKSPRFGTMCVYTWASVCFIFRLDKLLWRILILVGTREEKRRGQAGYGVTRPDLFSSKVKWDLYTYFAHGSFCRWGHNHYCIKMASKISCSCCYWGCSCCNLSQKKSSKKDNTDGEWKKTVVRYNEHEDETAEGLCSIEGHLLLFFFLASHSNTTAVRRGLLKKTQELLSPKNAFKRQARLSWWGVPWCQSPWKKEGMYTFIPSWFSLLKQWSRHPQAERWRMSFSLHLCRQSTKVLTRDEVRAGHSRLITR